MAPSVKLDAGEVGVERRRLAKYTDLTVISIVPQRADESETDGSVSEIVPNITWENDDSPHGLWVSRVDSGTVRSALGRFDWICPFDDLERGVGSKSLEEI